MILLSITLFVFINIFRWAELSENTTLMTFKDYFNFNDKIFFKLAFVWFEITLFIWLFLNFNEL